MEIKPYRRKYRMEYKSMWLKLRGYAEFADKELLKKMESIENEQIQRIKKEKERDKL